jgi:glycosyl transferase family 2
MAELPAWKRYVYGVIAAEISSFIRYYDRLFQWLRVPGDTGFLLDSVAAAEKLNVERDFDHDLRSDRRTRSAILLNGTFNVRSDIQQLLRRLKSKMARSSRIVAVLYNPYYSVLYRAATRFGLKSGETPTTFVTYPDLRNLARLAGFEIVRIRPAVFFPLHLLGIGGFINRFLGLVPILRHLGLVAVVVLRPIVHEEDTPTLSILVPARNERENIQVLLDRLPPLPAGSEVVFIEGHSTDGTWEEIQRAVRNGKAGIALSAHQQTGIGKNDAVRLGMQHAQCDLVAILDADLSVQPEDLHLFYDAYREGHGDFINGTRLVYPMETFAMQTLNKIANVFFAKALTFTLAVRVTDALCGTKLMARHDIQRFQRWREEFGDFDPFGDFELLFPAAILGLGIVDIPVHYRARTYGQTNIRRFRDGLRLLRMTLIALFRIKAGRVP